MWTGHVCFSHKIELAIPDPVRQLRTSRRLPAGWVQVWFLCGFAFAVEFWRRGTLVEQTLLRNSAAAPCVVLPCRVEHISGQWAVESLTVELCSIRLASSAKLQLVTGVVLRQEHTQRGHFQEGAPPPFTPMEVSEPTQAWFCGRRADSQVK